jgi:hypothetical protein
MSNRFVLTFLNDNIVVKGDALNINDAFDKVNKETMIPVLMYPDSHNVSDAIRFDYFINPAQIVPEVSITTSISFFDWARIRGKRADEIIKP